MQTWSPAELDLARALVEGTVLDLGNQPDATIRAEMIRHLMTNRGEATGPPDPRGLRLAHATLVGRLDLENVCTDIPIELFACLIPDGINLRDARLAGLSLDACRFVPPDEGPDSGDQRPAIVADRVEVRMVLDLNNLTVDVRAGEEGAVRLPDARISRLYAGRATITNQNGPGVVASGLQVEAALSLVDTKVSATGEALDVVGARVGDLDLTGASLSSTSGPALSGSRLRVVLASRMAQIEGRGSGALGAVQLSDAHLGSLDLTDVAIVNESGPALVADRLVVDAQADLGFEIARGVSADGAVSLVGAQVGGLLTVGGKLLINPEGPALAADRLRVGSTAKLIAERIEGSGERGAVRFVGTHVASQLVLKEVKISNRSGPAVSADWLTVDGGTSFLSVTATGHGRPYAAVQLSGAQLGGSLHIDGSSINVRAEDGYALRLRGARVAQELDLRQFSTEPRRIDLTAVTVGGPIRGQFTTSDGGEGRSHELETDGLTYAGMPRAGVERWVDILARAPYAAQPYRHLAAATAAAGHDSQTRQVLMAQRRHQLRDGATLRERIWGSVTRWTLGYGYQPWRALWWLLGVLIVTTLVFLTVGATGLHLEDHPDRRCSPAERVIVAIDTTLPLVDTDVSSTCTARSAPNRSGQVISASAVVAQVAAWAFATLFVAGFTSAVRKT